jgi:hypothetical protein
MAPNLFDFVIVGFDGSDQSADALARWWPRALIRSSPVDVEGRTRMLVDRDFHSFICGIRRRDAEEAQ